MMMMAVLEALANYNPNGKIDEIYDQCKVKFYRTVKLIDWQLCMKYEQKTRHFSDI